MVEWTWCESDRMGSVMAITIWTGYLFILKCTILYIKVLLCHTRSLGRKRVIHRKTSPCSSVGTPVIMPVTRSRVVRVWSYLISTKQEVTP